MKQLKNDQNVIMFDVDDTLVMWNYQPNVESIIVECPYSGKDIELWPHKRHIDFLEREYCKGNSVVVWSRSGQMWAESIVNKLGIANHIELIMCKPVKYVDDKDDKESIIGMRVYLDIKGKSI
jgi:hypothetical protein